MTPSPALFGDNELLSAAVGTVHRPPDDSPCGVHSTEEFTPRLGIQTQLSNKQCLTYIPFQSPILYPQITDVFRIIREHGQSLGTEGRPHLELRNESPLYSSLECIIKVTSKFLNKFAVTIPLSRDVTF